MDVTPMIPADRQVIDTYGPGLFRVANTVYTHPVIVFPDRVAAWAVTDFPNLKLEDFAEVAAASVEILLIGSGAKMQLMHSSLKRALRDAGIRADVMDTGAACRTYNVLLAEERRVAAALLPV
ncbi:MAG TPA: Mth938-like domain-containing protein [Azospirillaceae bacterium]|nr:Mth938-like domain-containing protein [Azospirillaceae bacterium]